MSYLTARKSLDPIAVAHQAVTRRWWRRRKRFDLYCSQVVVSEAGEGDAQAARRRMAALKGVPSLETSDAVKGLAAALVKAAALPKKATEDALHIALATVHGMDYLLTWNCTHIANAEIRNVVAAVAYDHGYGIPVICTPEELMGE
ncbi:type II toxin-antitoxin system VapC family toxin [Candidatus Binatia bacterium]|nr:type II toxin-antitoxin system VapC family toxin [Candidatus Binatia bacterium]